MICSKDDSGVCCGICEYNPVVVIATHERIEITTKNINSLKLQHPTPKIVVICSTQEELEYYKALGVSVALEPNKPLGRKWQCGVHIAKNLNANPMIILGSDDLISNDFFKKTFNKLNEGYEFIGCTEWITWDVKNNKYYHCKYQNANKDYPIGSGKVYSKSLLKKINYKVFDPKADRKLDDQGHRMIVANNANVYLFREPLVLAVKGGWNEMNKVEAYLRTPNIKPEVIDNKFLKNFNV